MFSSHASLALLISTALLAPTAFATNVHSAPTRTHISSAHKLTKSRHHVSRTRGQQAIDADRVTQIQQALIREHYLTGDADGKWDPNTIAAMQKYQADHGWQTKLMPDSRALKTLGLGPDYSGAINASNSSFATPPAAVTAPPVQTAGFVIASGVN